MCWDESILYDSTVSGWFIEMRVFMSESTDIDIAMVLRWWL
jgi:hypothetical protein